MHTLKDVCSEGAKGCSKGASKRIASRNAFISSLKFAYFQRTLQFTRLLDNPCWFGGFPHLTKIKKSTLACQNYNHAVSFTDS